MMLHKRRKWFYLSRVKLPPVYMSARWFKVSTCLSWILGVQTDSVKQPIWRNSVDSGHVSHCRTSALHDHFGHSFIVFQNGQMGFRSESFALVTTWSSLDNSSTSWLLCIFVLVLGLICVCVLWVSLCNRFPVAGTLISSRDRLHHVGRLLTRMQNLPPHPTYQEQEYSETLSFASCTSNLEEQTFDFRRCIKLSPRLIKSLQDRQQSLSLGTNPIDNDEPCFPHDNIVGDHSCDECMLSHELSVRHRLLSILVSARASLFTD